MINLKKVIIIFFLVVWVLFLYLKQNHRFHWYQEGQWCQFHTDDVVTLYALCFRRDPNAVLKALASTVDPVNYNDVLETFCHNKKNPFILTTAGKRDVQRDRTC